LVTDAIKSTRGNKENHKTKGNVEISTDIHVENPLKVAENECDMWGGRYVINIAVHDWVSYWVLRTERVEAVKKAFQKFHVFWYSHCVAGLVARNLSMERSAFERQGVEEE